MRTWKNVLAGLMALCMIPMIPAAAARSEITLDWQSSGDRRAELRLTALFALRGFVSHTAPWVRYGLPRGWNRRAAGQRRKKHRRRLIARSFNMAAGRRFTVAKSGGFDKGGRTNAPFRRGFGVGAGKYRGSRRHLAVFPVFHSF